MAKTYKTGLVITGDSKGGVRAIQATEQELSKLDKQSRRNQRTATAMAGAYDHLSRNATRYAAAAGVAVTGAVALTARQAAATTETAALAEAVGTTTGELQAFQYALQSVGVEGGKADDIIKDLQDKLGDAALTGGGEMADVLDRINVSAQDLQSMGPTDQLIAISDAIQDLPRAQQVNILESIADDATRLLPLLEDNGRRLRELNSEAWDVGFAQNDQDVQTMIEANRSMQRMTGIARGLGNEFAVAVAPSLSSFNDELDGLRDAIDSPAFQRGMEIVGQGVAWIGQQAAASVEDLAELREVLSRPWDEVLQGFVTGDYSRPGASGGWQKGASGSWGESGDSGTPSNPMQMDPIVNEATAPATAAIDKQRSAVDKLESTYASMNERLSEQVTMFGETGEAARIRYEIEQGSLQGLSASRQQNLLDMADELDAMEAQKDKASELEQLRNDLATRDQRARQTLNKRMGLIEGIEDPQERRRLAGAAREAYLESTKDDIEETSSFASRAADNIQDEMGTTLSATLSGEFDGILGSWTSMLNEMVAQATAAQIGDALFGENYGDSGEIGGLLGTAASAIGGHFGGGVSASAGASLSDAGISAFSNFPRFHTGGIVGNDESPAVLQNGEGVFTQAQMKALAPAGGGKGGGGGDVYVNITNNGEQVQEQSRSTRRDDNGDQIIDIQLEKALGRLAENGRLDGVMSPFGRRQGQI